MMSRGPLWVVVAVTLAGCASHNKRPAPSPVKRKLFRHRDLDFLIPQGWTFLEDESQPERPVFQDSTGACRVTISLMYYKSDMPGVELEQTFRSYVETRRKAEKSVAPSPTLTDCAIKKGDGYWYTKYGGCQNTTDQRSATLVTAENGKLVTVYVETIGTDDASFNALANDVFSSVGVK